MKLSLKHPRARTAGFTLVEIYTVSAIMVVLVIAVTACQLFALRIYSVAATKLTATEGARKGMNEIRDQVRAAALVWIGNYAITNNTFTQLVEGTNFEGNAIVVFPVNNTNDGTVFFMNQSTSNLCSVILTNNAIDTATLTTNIINYITNYYVFSEESAITNSDGSFKYFVVGQNYEYPTIHMIFQFSQWEYPLAGVGPGAQGAMYDFYQLQCRVTPRAIDY
jgi:hypothetical protein